MAYVHTAGNAVRCAVSRTPSSSSGGSGGEVIALSRYRAQLQRGRRARRAEELFAASDPGRAIRALPGDELYYIVSEMGLPDAMEVVQHASAAQVQTILDFALWDRDLVATDRADEWLAALSTAPTAAVAEWVRGVDVELFALLVRRRARIYDLSTDEPPDEPEGALLNTPDRLFVLDLLGEGDEPAVTARLVDALYREDSNLVRRLLVGTRGELDAELEETAYRWRSGRMADLGFVDFYEALEVYRELDPASVTVGGPPAERLRPEADGGNHLRLPSLLAERLAAGGTAFARALAGISEAAALSDLHDALVALCNRVLSADRVSPADPERVGAVLARVAATLDLAVEFLGRASEERATAAVRSVPLPVIFRVGVSLVGKVKRLGLALARQTPFARAGRQLFEREDAEVLAAVTQLRPFFPRRLDVPPAAGERPFASLADVAIATAALERIGAAVLLLHRLGIRPDQLDAAFAGVDPVALDLGVVARTILVDRLTGAAPGSPLRRVPPEALVRLAQRFADPSARPALQREVRDIVSAAAPGGTMTPAMTEVADRWAASLVPLEPVLTADGLTRP
jgi:hypothetical protein